jgi:hypothetical protein
MPRRKKMKIPSTIPELLNQDDIETVLQMFHSEDRLTSRAVIILSVDANEVVSLHSANLTNFEWLGVLRTAENIILGGQDEEQTD